MNGSLKGDGKKTLFEYNHQTTPFFASLITHLREKKMPNRCGGRITEKKNHSYLNYFFPACTHAQKVPART